MVEPSKPSKSKYCGLSRREFEMRKKMAAKFGRSLDLEDKKEPEEDVDFNQLYSKLTVQTPVKIPSKAAEI